MKHMAEVGIRALKQNASDVVGRAAKGERITITDRGRPVAVVTPLPSTSLQGLLDAGLARPPRRSMADLSAPDHGANLTEQLVATRDDERY